MEERRKIKLVDAYRRQTYATNRAILAVNRLAHAQALDERIIASHWARAWMNIARGDRRTGKNKRARGGHGKISF
ncbi:hypothetical protein [Noviherbaspirillum pedocola]|uniref:Uncharacterized protein n=1 Tax=Noviherbaspirillum pedocola TaxID=2801341 RepID=A0A934W930_9BURK|nr:hypothetical protein [Noviherbaspirillum pedocola]MBK4739362.1 hypothetical protein [Noviherbaspirillum pedocola]